GDPGRCGCDGILRCEGFPYATNATPRASTAVAACSSYGARACGHCLVVSQHIFRPGNPFPGFQLSLFTFGIRGEHSVELASSPAAGGEKHVGARTREARAPRFWACTQPRRGWLDRTSGRTDETHIACVGRGRAPVSLLV